MTEDDRRVTGVLATGVGSLPGGSVGGDEATGARAYAETVRLVLSELPSLPHVPEMPGRGVAASMTGRGLAVLAELSADLQPHGWRLTDSPGIDHRRARSLLGHDLDQVEEIAAGYDGIFKAQIAGPWTLAATVELPRGGKVLADHGARRDLAQAYAAGLAEHVADLRRRLPAVSELIVQVDEPALPAVLAGQVPTISGWGRHRVIHPPEASEHLEWAFSAIAAQGATPMVHSCAAEVPVDLLRGAGARGLSVDVGTLVPSAFDALAEAFDAGDRVFLGMVPSTEAEVATRGLAERVRRLLDLLGWEVGAVSDRLVITPTCGLAGAGDAWARQAMRTAREVAEELSE